MKNNTQQKPIKQRSYETDLFPSIKKENPSDKINLAGPPNNDSKYTMNQFVNLHDPLDTILLSKIEIENIFLRILEKITLELLQKHEILTQLLEN